MNESIESRLKKLEKNKAIKKFKYEDQETPTRLEPNKRLKFSIRDVEDLIEEEDDIDESAE
jgi:hypothetical protein